MLKLDKNEYNFQHHPILVSTLSKIDFDNITYYDTQISNQDIVLKLSKILSCKPENILLTAGGIGGIELLFNVYLKKSLTTTSPTYSAIRRHVIKNNAQFIEINTYLDKQCDTSIFPPDNETVIYICNPNNPTGMIWSVNDIKNYAMNTPNIIIVDEVYIDFAEIETCINLINLENVIIVRSFSKSYGLAGVRFGYLLAHPNVIKHLEKYYEPLHVTNMAKIFAYQIMEY